MSGDAEVLMRKLTVQVSMVVAGLVLTMTACSSSNEASTGGGARTTVGWAAVSLPKEYTVVTGTDRPAGWDWVAQDQAGTAATVQLAVDGELGHYTNAGLAMGVLQVGPQVGSLPEWAQVGEESQTTMDGADEARTLRFSYVPDQGRTYHGAWLVGCRRTTQQCVAVQVTSSAELTADQVDDLFAHVSFADRAAQA
jgi:hypothetical protein